MGKDLKGKELGVGISQLKDGRYTARFTTKSGKRIQKYFKKLQECRAWIADAQFQDEHGSPLLSDSPTADAWFDYWINEVKGSSLRTRTTKVYKDRWRIAISPYIGNMELKDIKPIHCQNILNALNENHAVSYIKNTRILLSTILDCATENEFIPKNPVTKSIRQTGGKPKKVREALSLGEQKKFLEKAKSYEDYYLFAFALQTGLRYGELAALTWSDIDFKNKVLHVNKSIVSLKGIGLVVGETKTKTSVRDVPLTEEAIRILKAQKEKLKTRKIIKIECKDAVFVNRLGRFLSNSCCDAEIKCICKNAGIKSISMHILRHTFATRCIEGGMRPKTLQVILGHKNLEMTMDLYVHVTDEAKSDEMKSVEENLVVV